MEEPAKPTARFEAVNGGCMAPCSVQFKDLSENKGVYNWHYSWTLNDSAEFSSVHDPILEFQEGGLYRVMLTLMNDKYGTSSYEDTITILEPVKPPVADFKYMITDSLKKDSIVVSFNNISTNATSFLWDFGDAKKSVVMSPTHKFVRGKLDAKFIVTLTALGTGAMSIKSDTIKVKKK
jgi:PKD repeat protein